MQFKECSCLQLNQFYKQHKDKARAKATDVIYVAIEKEVIHTGLRLLRYDEYFFLRSVFTAPKFRGQGIASALLSEVIKGCSHPIYTLPTAEAVGLYQRLGFKDVATCDIPAGLSASYRRFRQSSKGPTVMVINN